MGNQKVTELTALATLDPDDIIYAVDDPAGSPLSRKITMENVVKAGMGVTSSDILSVEVVLHEETLAAAGSFDVSSISQDYTHLEIIIMARGDISAAVDGLRCYFNNDTTDSNYYSQYMQGNAAAAAAAATDAPAIVPIPGDTAPANMWGTQQILIPLYSGTLAHKTMICTGMYRTAAASQAIMARSISWESTAAINRITIVTDNDPTDLLLTGSYLLIIGIKSSG